MRLWIRLFVMFGALWPIGDRSTAAASDIQTILAQYEPDPADTSIRDTLKSDADAPEIETETVTVIGEAPVGASGFDVSDSLSASEIAAMGVETIGDIVRRICSLGSGEGDQTLVLMNGKEQPDMTLADIVEFPAGAIERIEILSAEAAAAFGREGSCSVINVVMKRNYSSTGVFARHSRPDRGHTGANQIRLDFSHLNGERRILFTGHAEHQTRLLESDRNVTVPTPDEADFFASPGNILAASADRNDEIDPALSALAGETVTIVGLPQTEDPAMLTLAALLPFANSPDQLDSRAARTLRPDLTTASVRLYYDDRFAKNVTAKFYSFGDYRSSEALRGFAQQSLLTPASNAFTPFSTDVTVNHAFVAAGPITQKDESGRLVFRPLVTFKFDKVELYTWSYYRYSFSKSVQPNDPDREQLDERLADTDPETAFNPFDVEGNGELVRAGFLRGNTETFTRSHRVTLGTGGHYRPFKLPGGPLLFRAKLKGTFTDSLYETLEQGDFTATQFDELTRSTSGFVSVPIFGQKFTGPGLGDISLNADILWTKQGAADPALTYGYGASWLPANGFSISVRRIEAEEVPDEAARNAPITANENNATFDPLTGETVFIRILTGGNPDLLNESSTTALYELDFKPEFLKGLRLNAQYRDELIQNQIASLPDFDINTERFYPDRVLRNQNGQLIQIDQRRLNLSSVELGTFETQLSFRWGSEEDSDSDRPFVLTRIRYQRELKNRVTATPGADVQDFLNGDTGFLRAKDQLDSSFLVAYRGLSVFSDVDYHASRRNIGGVNSEGVSLPDIFIPRLITVDFGMAYQFHEKGLLQAPGALHGLRLSFGIDNVFDRRQIVLDENGDTPRRYQVDYQDPLGRVIYLEAGWRF